MTWQPQPNQSEDLIRDFFPEISAQMLREEEKKQQKLERLLQNQAKYFDKIKDRQNTFAAFGFKTQEKSDDYYIRPFIRNLEKGSSKSTMSVCDLWNQRQQGRYMKNFDFASDKLTLLKMAKFQQQRNEFVKKKVKPYFLSRKEELVLMSKVYQQQQRKRSIVRDVMGSSASTPFLTHSRLQNSLERIRSEATPKHPQRQLVKQPSIEQTLEFNDFVSEDYICSGDSLARSPLSRFDNRLIQRTKQNVAEGGFSEALNPRSQQIQRSKNRLQQVISKIDFLHEENAEFSSKIEEVLDNIQEKLILNGTYKRQIESQFKQNRQFKKE